MERKIEEDVLQWMLITFERLQWGIAKSLNRTEQLSYNKKLCDNILCEKPNIKYYHWKCTDCKAKSLTWLKNLKRSNNCYVKNVDCHLQDRVISLKQFERIDYFHAGKSKKKLSLNDKCVTLKEFVQYFHEKIENFRWSLL